MSTNASASGAVAAVPEVPDSLTDFLLGHQAPGEYRAMLSRGIDRLARTLAEVDRPFSGRSPSELRPEVDAVDLDRPVTDIDAVLTELESVYLRDAVYFHHPRYAAHLNCPIALPAVLAELILSTVNSSVDTWDQSAGATLIEQKLVAWTAGRIGYPDTADGVFTSGGTQSNLMAMLLARAVARERAGGGRDVDGGLRILASELSHFSVRKAATILGLDEEAVVAVAVDRNGRMDLPALRARLAECRRDGLRPMAVVATAGTTDFGTIDPLGAIADVCRRHGVWLHADAAYGCGLLVSPTRRHWLAGLERADSVTVDYHKSFFQPVSCGAFLVRDGGQLGRLTYHADYLNPACQRREGTPNQVDKSIQTTRRFDALKLWLTLRTVGPEAIGAAFDRTIDLAAAVHARLRADPRMQVCRPPELGCLVFRYRPQGVADGDTLDAVNGGIRKAVMRSGQAMVARTRAHGRVWLKLTLLNPAAGPDDIEAVLALVREHGERLAGNR